MSDENKKSIPGEISDEALDSVVGGASVFQKVTEVGKDKLSYTENDTRGKKKGNVEKSVFSHEVVSQIK